MITEETEQSYPVLTVQSDLSVLHKICYDIRVQMDKIPDYKDLRNLDIRNYKQFIPNTLYFLINLLVTWDETQATNNDTRVLAICQDIIYTYSEGRKRTQKHIGLGIMIHQETRSKKLVEHLHTTGHCISYKEVLRLRNSIAQEEIYRFKKNNNTVIPRQLVPNWFVQFAADNIDILEETLDKAPTFHATQMVAFQQGPPNRICHDQLNLLPYEVKLNIPESFHIIEPSYCFKMTKSSPAINNKDALPQWSGFNKLLAAESTDEHITTYGYLPLLPYVSTEYDTVWAVMKSIKQNQAVTDSQALKSTLNKLSESFKEYVDSQVPTLKFCERTGDWTLHLQSFNKMLPLFFTYDHTNYARWGSIYLLDMLNLPQYVKEKFESGQFVVKRLPGSFNKLSVDQALEHVNKRSKDTGGIVGLTKNSTRLDEWFLSFNEIGLMVDSFQFSLSHSKSINPISQNIESGIQRKKIDEQTVLTLQEQLTRFSLFSCGNDQLLCISTNEIIAKSIEKSLLNAVDIGEQALANFMTTQVPLPKKAEKAKSVQGCQSLLQQILAANQMGRNIEKNDIFQYELTTFPMALFSGTHILATPTNKSSLGNIVEQFTTSVKELPVSSKKTCHIFDAMSIVQSLGKPAAAKTFLYYGNVFNSVLSKNKYNASRLDLVFDHYTTQSIKNLTRVKRQSGCLATIKGIINSPDMPLPQQWHRFIHSGFNKQQLTNFLSNYLFEQSSINYLQK
ncbi:unnamed protein product [Ceutorhynchus assimilis]|uniref:Uncharacterized protein n=1 Tax=Ceutorhynchus assimilis TaxID=467358 RepID=A0A9N9QJJ1_9CUCU|nr:unnamed protein product [Ceutorhynchus assimilis]